MTLLSWSALISRSTAAELYRAGLELAAAVGLDVTSWREGDPTRTSYKFLAQVLGTQDGVVVEYVKASMLSWAEEDWLTILASEVYGVEREGATFAEPELSFSNAGGVYEYGPGEITLRNSVTNKTYRNLETVTFASNTPLTGVVFVANEEGSDSSVGVNEVDEIVSPPLLGVTITGSTASSARDAQDDESLRDQCRDSRGALSPNGPPDAYEYVAKNSDLTGTTAVTRAKSIDDDDSGDVTVYLAGPSGEVSGPTVTAVQTAFETYATPLCITPTAISASNVVFEIEFVAEGDLPAGWEDLVEAALGTYFGTIGIGALVARSKIITEIHKAVPAITSVTLAEPALDVQLDEGEVAVLGSVEGTEA